MSSSGTPTHTEGSPDVRTFEAIADFLSAIRPGMAICTSDFAGWATVDEVIHGGRWHDAFVLGHVNEDGRTVRVPAHALLDLRGDCVRLDRVRASVDGQGWDD